MLQKYLITSREFYTDTPAVFRSILHEQFITHMPQYALYRDKSNPAYAIQASHFVEVCAQFEDIKSFIHQDVELAKELFADGVHLTSKQFERIKKAKELGLEVIVSTHTFKEIQIAQDLGADAVTYSPIFSSPGKGESKGVKNLEGAVKKFDIHIFALGGIITDEQLTSVTKTGVYGFASIRYFYKVDNFMIN